MKYVYNISVEFYTVLEDVYGYNVFEGSQSLYKRSQPIDNCQTKKKHKQNKFQQQSIRFLFYLSVFIKNVTREILNNKNRHDIYFTCHKLLIFLLLLVGLTVFPHFFYYTTGNGWCRAKRSRIFTDGFQDPFRQKKNVFREFIVLLWSIIHSSHQIFIVMSVLGRAF